MLRRPSFHEYNSLLPIRNDAHQSSHRLQSCEAPLVRCGQRLYKSDPHSSTSLGARSSKRSWPVIYHSPLPYDRLHSLQKFGDRFRMIVAHGCSILIIYGSLASKEKGACSLEIV